MVLPHGVTTQTAQSLDRSQGLSALGATPTAETKSVSERTVLAFRVEDPAAARLPATGTKHSDRPVQICLYR